MRASDLPALMAEDCPREHVPLTLFVKDWEHWPDSRGEMVADPPAGGDADDLCRIAAVVHALCERDCHPVPEWVHPHRSDRPLAWGRNFPTSGGFWDRMVANAPPACQYHNVWFDYQFISSARRNVTKDNYRDHAPAPSRVLPE